MTLASLTVLPVDMPSLALNPAAPPLVVPTAFDKIMAASRPDHWYEADSYSNGQWIDKGSGNRTLINSTATAPTVGQIGGSGPNYVNVANASALNPTDSGVLLESTAAFTLMLVRHGNGGTDNDPIIARPPNQTVDASNRVLEIYGYANSTNEQMQFVVAGATSTTLLNTTTGNHPSRSVPHLIMVSYSPTNGFRIRIDNSLYNTVIASPAQTVNVGRFQIGRYGTSTGGTNFAFGGYGLVATWSRDITLSATEYAAIYPAILSKFGILT